MVVSAVIIARNQEDLAMRSGNNQNYATTAIPLSDVSPEAVLGLAQIGQLDVNGRMQVNGALVLTPQEQPKDAKPGTVYFDKTTNQVVYFNGTDYRTVADTQNVITNINGQSGALTLGSGLSLANGILSSSINPQTLTQLTNNTGVTAVQGQKGSVTFTGTNGITITGTTIANSGITRLGNLTGDVTLGFGLGVSGNELRSNTTITTDTPSELDIVYGLNGIVYVNKVGSGAGGTVALAPSAAQTDSTNNDIISINKTGSSGNLVMLAANGTPAFVVDSSGEITTGSIGYDKIVNTPGAGLTSLGFATGDLILGSGLALDTLTKTISLNLPSGASYITSVDCPTVGPGCATADPYQQANLKVESKNSAYTTATISGTTGQTADILKVKASGVVPDLFSISQAGVATFQPSVNSTASFKIFNQDATNQIFTVDSINNRVGINKASPQYTLDVSGTVNVSDSLQVGGVEVCTVTGCLTQASAGNFVPNSTTLSAGNIALQTFTDNQVTVTLQATAGQFKGLVQLQTDTGIKTLSIFANQGKVLEFGVGLNRTEISFATPTSDFEIVIPTGVGTDTLCVQNISTLVSNCSGSGGGGISASGTYGTIAAFSGATSLANSFITQNSNTITMSQQLKVTASTGLTIGIPSTVGGGGKLVFANLTNGNLITIATQSGGNAATLNVPSGSGTLVVNATAPLVISATTGELSCPNCLVSGGGSGSGTAGVTSVNTGTGDVIFNDAVFNSGQNRYEFLDATTGSQKGVAYFSNTNFTVNSGLVNTVQNINTAATPTFSRLSLQGGTNSPTLGTASLSLGTAGPSLGADGGIDFYNSVNGSRVRLGFSGLYPAGNINLYLPTSGGTLVSTATLPLSISASGQISLSTVGVDKGGTGNTTVGVNELLYGSGGTTMNKLAAAGSAGLCLTSAAVTFVPSWGSCAGSVGNGVTLQGAYANYNTNPAYIDLTNSLGGLVIRDNATPINKVVGSLTGSLFAVQNSTSSSTYLNVTAASTTISNILRIPGVSGVLKVTSGTVSGTTVSLSGTDVTGTLPTSLGGTGIGGATPYTTGDLLYASGAGTLSKLSIGAHQQGECLIVASGLPTWGACAGSGSGVTLQNAYINSPVDGTANATLIELNKVNTNNGLLLRDTAGGIGGNLFAVQSAGGATTYLGVAASGVTINGNLTLQGTGNLTATGATFTAANALTLGTSQAQTGGITFYSSAASSAGTALRARTSGEGKNAANRTITFPDYLDASQQYYVCVGVGPTQDSVCGLAGASGSFIQNQNASPQTANFYISGTGRATTGFIAPSYDAPSGGSLSIGTNATAGITLQQATNVAGNLTFTTGANRTLSVATQATLNTAGNNLTVNSATGNGTGAGGVLTVQSGAGGTTGNGGALSLQAGSGGATSGNGGTTTLSGGSATTSGAGGNVSITGGNAAGTNQNAGNVTIVAGAKTGSGTAGTVTIKPTTGATNDTTNFFQVQNNAGTAILTTDTTSSRVVVGPAGTVAAGTPTGQLYVSGNLPTSALNGSGTATGATPYAIAINGKYAYVVNQDSTLQVFDISNPASPVSIASTATDIGPNDIAVSGKYAFVANYVSNNLQVFDISNPVSPTYITSIASTASGPIKIAIQGRYLYLANNSAGSSLQIIDINNPANPVTVGNVPGLLWSGSVAAQGRYVYVLEGNSGGFKVVDVSNPASPTGVGATTSGLVDIAVSGRYAYVVNNTNVLQVVDIGSPASPSVVGSVATGQQPNSVVVSGRYVYVTNANSNTLEMFDVSTPTSPISMGTVGTANLPWDLAISGRYAFVVNNSSGTLQTFDLGGTYTSSLEAGALEATSARVNNDLSVGGNLALQGGLTVSGSTLLTGNTGITGSLQVNNSALFKNATNSTSALTIATAGGSGTNVFNVDTTGTGAVTVQSAGSTSAFKVQGSAGTILNVDTTNNRVTVGPSIGTATGQLYVGGVVNATSTGSIAYAGTSLRSIAIKGRYVYAVGSGNILQIFDVSNPTTPVSVGQIATDTLPYEVAVEGKYAYVVNYTSNTMQIIDISNPSTPSVVATLGGFNNPGSVVVSGRYAYIANRGTGTISVIDVSNPIIPVIVATQSGLGTPCGISLSGRYLYVANNTGNSMSIIDVINPIAPTITSTIGGLSNPCAINVVGRYAYVTNLNVATNSMSIIDVSNPSSASIVGTRTGFNGPNSLAVSGRFALVANINVNTVSFVDISTVGSPVISGTYSAGMNGPNSIKVSGRYAYIANFTGNNLVIVDIGGTYSQSLESGSLETTNMQVNGDVSVGGNVSLQGGMSVAGTTLLSATGISGNLQVNNTALFKNNTDSTSAFSIQDASATPKVLLSVDTTNKRISVGSIGTATGQLYVAGQLPSFVTSISGSMIQAGAVEVVGNYAYVKSSGALKVFDVSRPQTPALIGTSGYLSTTTSISVKGRYVYTAGNTDINVIDVSNPFAPTVVGTLVVPGVNFQKLKIVGRYAYAVDAQANTVKVIDISNPVSPTLVGSVATPVDSRSLAVQGNYLYVSSCSSTSVRVYSLSDPVNPSTVSTYTAPACIYDMDVSGSYVYTVGNSYFQVINISNPASLTAVSLNIGLSVPNKIVVSGRYAYAISGTGASYYLRMFDISNPSSPYVVGETLINSTAGSNYLSLRGRFAYVSSSDDLLRIYDLGGTYSQAVEAGSLETTNARVNTDLSVGGNLALQGGLSVYGASLFDNNVAINGSAVLKNKTNSTKALDIQNAAGTTVAAVDTTNSRLNVGSIGTATGQLYVSGIAPVSKGMVSTSGAARNVTIVGSYAYITNQNTGRFEIYSIANVSLPTLTGSLNVSGGIEGIAVAGKYAYVTRQSTNQLQVVDISNPTAPANVVSVATGNAPGRLYVSGRYLYVLNVTDATLQIFDISNPANPVSKSTIATGTSPSEVIVSGKYAYVASQSTTATLKSYDISNPSSPSSVGTLNTGESGIALRVSGRYAYLVTISGLGSYLRTVDIKNPASMSLVGSFALDGYAYGIELTGRYVYAVKNTFGLNMQVVDVSNTSTLTLAASSMMGANAYSIAISGRTAVTVDDVYGLLTWDLGGTYSQTFESGTVETTTARVNNDASIGGSLSLQGGLTVAGASLLDGDLSVNGSVIFKNKVNSTTAFQIQNAAGTSFVTADSTNSKLMVTNLVVGGAAGNTLTVNAHIITGNPSGTTTIAAGAAACTTPTVSLTGNDTAGTITITTGTGCAATGTLATITFSAAYGAAPSVVVTPQDSLSAGLIRYATQATGSFVIGTNTIPADSTTYKYSYFVAQ